MTRQEMISRLNSEPDWDICIIGGGATGLGTAVDAASRGFRTILFEQSDFAKGTSSRSTKLVHGGVRYLQQGNIKLVKEALRERGMLKKNAAHLVKNQSFIVPNYKWWEGPYYGLGLKVYDWMSGSLGLGPSQLLSKEEVLLLAPTLDAAGLRGGVLYHDGQFDDARLAINLVQTAAEQGAAVINYCGVTGFLKSHDKITGLTVKDVLTGIESEIRCKAVINATGVFSDAVQQLDEIGKAPVITPSQGIHLVLDKDFLPGDTAIMVPHTDDGRVLFAVPWHNRIIMGTTDTPVDKITADPVPLESEIDFILHHVSRYLTKDPRRDDIKSMFAGLRPLVKANTKKTAEISRDHSVILSSSGLISIVGGKWTTYRKMAEDVVDITIKHNRLKQSECVTGNLSIHGCTTDVDFAGTGYYYGTDLASVDLVIRENPVFEKLIHPLLPYRNGDIIWSVRNEFCITLEDALLRRTRALLLDARATIEAAPAVARLMASEMGHDEDWTIQQTRSFADLAKTYLPEMPHMLLPEHADQSV